jgi:putative ABC transport system permease protein
LRHLFTESLLLAAIGGALGSRSGFRAGASGRGHALPDSLPRLNEIAVRWPMLLVALALTGMTGILCGWAPAFAGIKPDVLNSLREAGRGAGSSRSQSRMRGVLATLEVSLAMLLLVASGLLLRSFANMLATDPGFEPQHVLTASLVCPSMIIRLSRKSTPSITSYFARLLPFLR